MTGLGDIDRRSFLRGRLTAEPFLPRPPGSAEASVRSACTGCGECVAACPQQIIRLDRHSQASIVFNDAECTFCGLCAEVCEEPVFDRAARPSFAHVAQIGAECFAARGIVCQTCGDCCPEDAIKFSARLGGPSLPTLDSSRCSGCGACVGACPADAIAITPGETCHG